MAVLFLPVVSVVCFFSEGEQVLVNTEVSHPVGHPEGQEGVSPAGVCVVWINSCNKYRLTPAGKLQLSVLDG